MIIIRVVDLETTGFPPDAEPIEIATIDVEVVPLALPRVDLRWLSSLVRPTVSIPPTASAVHHLIDADLLGERPWVDIWPRFNASAPDYWCAHTAKMERAFITDEMTGGKPWIDTWKCALRLWPEAPSHSNQALRYWLKPAGLDRNLAAFAHRAGPDAYVTAHHLAVMLTLKTAEELAEWSAEPALLPRVPFGMHRGTAWTDVDTGFLEWILVRDFDEDVLFAARTELNRRRAVRDAEAATESDNETLEAAGGAT